MNEGRTLDQNKSLSVHSLSLSMNENNRNSQTGDVIALNQTLTTQRPKRPEVEKKRPTSNGSFSTRKLSQSHSSIQELRRVVSSTSVTSNESNASYDAVSMNPEPYNIDMFRSNSETSHSNNIPPPLPAKYDRITHTDLTTSDFETTIGPSKPLQPVRRDLQPLPTNYRPIPKPRSTKAADDVYKNVNSIRRNISKN